MPVVCPICGEPTVAAKRFVRERFRLCIAKDCGVLFRHPQPSEVELETYYREDYYSDQADRHAVKYPETPEPLYELIVSHLVPRSSASQPVLLDVGCATGGLWDALAHEEKQHYVGIEPDKVARADAIQRTGRPIFASVEEYARSDTSRWDVGMLIQVIQAMRDPLETLKILARSASPDAVLFVATPNLGGAKSKLLGSRWDQVRNRTQLFTFSAETCGNLLHRAGFERVDYLRFPIHYAHKGRGGHLIQNALRLTRLDGNLTMVGRASEHARDVV